MTAIGHVAFVIAPRWYLAAGSHRRHGVALSPETSFRAGLQPGAFPGHAFGILCAFTHPEPQGCL